MILSAQSLFSDDQVITGNGVSTNVIDLGEAGKPYDNNQLNQDVGKGEPVPVLIQVTDDFAGLTNLTVTLETSDSSDLSSSTVLNTQTIPVADLVAGKQTWMQCLPNGADGRYLGVRYAVTGGPASSGKITAGISMGNQTNITGA